MLPTSWIPKRKINRLLIGFALTAMMIMTFSMIKIRRRKEPPEENPDRRDFNFSLLLPFIEPTLPASRKKMFMAVIVNTAATGKRHRLLRQTIRNTWGKAALDDYGPMKSWQLFFLLGITDIVNDHESNLLEANHYNDAIVGNFTDHYYNLATKTFMGHYWVVTRLTCNYVLKTDDDVYVRVPETIQWLHEQGSPRPFYGGYVERRKLDVIRDKTDKWYITNQQYDKEKWPPYCHGAFHVLSSDAIPFIINSSRIRNPPFTDDAYIAVIMLNASIPATPIAGYWVFREFKFDCDLVNVKAIGHKMTDETMLKYYAFYQSHSDENIKWRCSFGIYKNIISRYITNVL